MDGYIIHKMGKNEDAFPVRSGVENIQKDHLFLRLSSAC